VDHKKDLSPLAFNYFSSIISHRLASGKSKRIPAC
jgi:hypothetical protein